MPLHRYLEMTEDTLERFIGVNMGYLLNCKRFGEEEECNYNGHGFTGSGYGCGQGRSTSPDQREHNLYAQVARETEQETQSIGIPNMLKREMWLIICNNYIQNYNNLRASRTLFP